MSIQDIRSQTNNPEQLQQRAAQEAKRVDASTAAASSQEPSTQATRDSVEISEAGRTAQSERVEASQELDFARRALDGLAPANEQRLGDIRQRMDQGYYNQPEVITRVAERLAAAFVKPAE